MGKTTQVAADRAHDATKTILPAEVARGVFMQHAPSLQALKLMHLMIGTAAGRMAEPVRHEIRLSAIRAIEGMNNHTRASLTPLFEELRACTLREGDPEDDGQRIVIGGILDHAIVDRRDPISGDVLMSWYFGRMFIEMAEKSNHWAILDRQTVFHLGSRYSVLLFQHIASLVPLEHVSSRTFTVAQLRALLGVPEGKMERFSNLNQRALLPSIEEINQLSRLTLTAIANKVGRTVVSVTISWMEKAPEAKAETKQELARPRVGRQARREGAVEAVTAPEAPHGASLAARGPFPASGGISYGAWGDLAREHLPRPLPDLDRVAGDFRRWAAERDLALSAAGVEKAFIGFCRKVGPAR